MKKIALPCGIAIAIAGCGQSVAPTASPSPAPAGLFEITTQPQRQPIVVVDNKSETPLRLLLNASDGSALKLDVPAFAKRKITVNTGHYEAKVIDVGGKVRSAYGSADIGEYKTYTAGFKEYYDGGSYTFHIGDSQPPGHALSVSK